MTAGRLFACYKQTGVPVAFSSDTSSGCGTQHPLRLCLRLAGHGPNNSSLLPPMAAVTVVAGHSIARPIACGNRVPPQRTVLGETPGPPPGQMQTYFRSLLSLLVAHAVPKVWNT